MRIGLMQCKPGDSVRSRKLPKDIKFLRDSVKKRGHKPKGDVIRLSKKEEAISLATADALNLKVAGFYFLGFIILSIIPYFFADSESIKLSRSVSFSITDNDCLVW